MAGGCVDTQNVSSCLPDTSFVSVVLNRAGTLFALAMAHDDYKTRNIERDFRGIGDFSDNAEGLF
jgi:hypothetical protein